MKPEPPPYPRPVPSIDFDEDPILPGTIVYTNDDEINQNERAAKRRRIEANANAYLRGEDLFILSAGLRGPFDNGWKNPWASKSKKRKAEIEEKPYPIKRARPISSNTEVAQNVSTTVVAPKQRQSLSVQENPFARTIRSSEPPTHDEKVESWLRRNDALPQHSFAVPTSPTPKKGASASGSNKTLRPTWTPTKQKITVNSQDIRAPSHHVPSRVPDSFDTVIPPGQQPAETHEKLQNALHAQDSAQIRLQDCYPITNGIKDEPVRAEEAIKKMKRSSEEPNHKDADALAQALGANRRKRNFLPESLEHLATENPSDAEEPPAASPKTHAASHPIPQDISRNDMCDEPVVATKIKLKELDASIDDQLQNPTDVGNALLRETECPVDHEKTATHHSTIVSELQSVRLPPSAQHKPELQTSASNMSSAALLPDVQSGKKIATLTSVVGNLSEQVGDAVPCSTTQQHEHTSRNVQPQVSSQTVLEKDERVDLQSVAQVRSSPRSSRKEVVAIQQISKSPVRESNTKTSQTSLDGRLARPPGSVQKVRSGKKTKKTSFATETSFASSHGSIKSVLKVQKVDVTDRAQKHTPPALSFSKSIDMNTSLEEGAEVPGHSSSFEMRKVPKSILRTRSTHSSPAAARASAMLSPRNREASSFSKMSQQDLSGQNGIVQLQQAEDFDLEGAMDDLGSFLSTWDAEKGSLQAM